MSLLVCYEADGKRAAATLPICLPHLCNAQLLLPLCSKPSQPPRRVGVGRRVLQLVLDNAGKIIFIVVVLGVVGGVCGAVIPAQLRKRGITPPPPPPGIPDKSAMQLIFNDDFDTLDNTTWAYELGNGADLGLTG